MTAREFSETRQDIKESIYEFAEAYAKRERNGWLEEAAKFASEQIGATRHEIAAGIRALKRS